MTVSKKFRVRDTDTVYTLGDLVDGKYHLSWTNSSGEFRQDTWDQQDADSLFEHGIWWFVDKGKPEVKSDAVNKPKHYAVFEQLEAIEVIASSMTAEQFYGYCLGNILKYRLRAGGKDDVMQELGKADRYQGLYNEFKHLCKGGV